MNTKHARHVDNVCSALGMVSGIKFDELELGQELGKGASSVVYKAKHKSLGQYVAVKKLTNGTFHQESLKKK
jgi:hypothetical protein